MCNKMFFCPDFGFRAKTEGRICIPLFTPLKDDNAELDALEMLTTVNSQIIVDVAFFVRVV